MAAPADSVVHAIKKYVAELIKNNIKVTEAILFGSHAIGTVREESDIDVALISEAFTGDRFEDRRRIVPLRRAVDTRIEPIPFRPEQFAEGGNLVDEIKRTGIRVSL